MLGMEREEEFSEEEADWERKLVTVVRQSTTVPKTSVSKALGGLEVDIFGQEKRQR